LLLASQELDALSTYQRRSRGKFFLAASSSRRPGRRPACEIRPIVSRCNALAVDLCPSDLLALLWRKIDFLFEGKVKFFLKKRDVLLLEKLKKIVFL
jgi:hypothetical protein